MKTLGEHVLQHPCVKKELLFSWMQQILTQLQAAELIREIPDRITPFHMEVADERVILLRELTEERMPSYSVLEKFYPKERADNNIYAFGKTIQFLLAKTKPVPGLTRKEEMQFQKIIEKCLSDRSKKKYLSFSNIQLNPQTKKKTIYIMLLSVAMLLQAAVRFIPEKPSIAEAEYFEMGLFYFLISEDYEASEEMFRNVTSKRIGNYYAEMSAYMAGRSNNTELEMEFLLNEANQLLEVQKEWRMRACIVRVYERVDTPIARRKIEELVEEITKETTYDEVNREMRKILANVYVREGEYENALREYRVLYEEGECRELQQTIKELEKKTH